MQATESQDADLALAAQRQRTALLNLHARAIAHELSNLTFLSEIRARQTPESPAGEEIRKALPFVRRLARLLADTLAPEPKPRILTIGDAYEEIGTLLIAPSKGQMPPCSLQAASEDVRQASYQECPGAILLIVQEVLRQLAVDAGSTMLEMTAAKQGDELVLELSAKGHTLTATPFVTTECQRNGFRLHVGNGDLKIAVANAKDEL